MVLFYQRTTKKFYNEIPSKDKKIHWMETELELPYHLFSFYDQDAEVKESISQVPFDLTLSYIECI